MADQIPNKVEPTNELQNTATEEIIDSANKSESLAKSNPITPYIIADLVFLATAIAVLVFGSRPMTITELLVVAFCVTAGAWCMIYPFKRRSDIELQVAQNQAINQSVAELNNLDSLVARIETASGNWAGIQEKAEQSLHSSQEMTSAMIKESESFKGFLQTAASEELQHLRLLLDKMKRAEKDWVDKVVAMLDHSTALKWAAQRSNNLNLIQQITNFQSKQVEIARQVGLILLEPKNGDSFDEELHQPASNDESIGNGDIITAPKSAGFKFRGVVFRKALVTCKNEELAQQLNPSQSTTFNSEESQNHPGSSTDSPQQNLL